MKENGGNTEETRLHSIDRVQEHKQNCIQETIERNQRLALKKKMSERTYEAINRKLTLLRPQSRSRETLLVV